MRVLGGLQLVVLALLHPSRGQVEQTCADHGEGFQCVDQAEAGKLNCTTPVSLATDSDNTDTRLSVLLPPKHCSGLLGSGQNFCCRPPVVSKCDDNGCSNTYKGFRCFSKDQAGSQQLCLTHLDVKTCGLAGGSRCLCCAPKHVDCEDVGCSKRGEGYECKSEKEAKEHPIPCHGNIRLCKKNCFIHNTGSTPYSPYNVDPSSPSPEDCQLKCQADPLCQWFNYVPASSAPSGCWLLKYDKTGENTAVSTIGWVTGPKYCSKCYCCPPVIVEPEPCEDTGCEKAFDGAGKCKDVKTANWDELDANFDLSAGSRDNNTCKKTGSEEKDCCRCLKRKSCLDAGCKHEFKGHGICVDLSKANVAHMKKTLDLPAGEIKGKCRNALKEDCCTCFKKITPDCKNRECEAKKGKCIIEGDRPPPNHEKSFPCNETLKCNCWVPIEPCHDDQCKGKCVGPHQKPPPGYINNGYNCSNDERCPCYVEKVDCSRDKMCTDGFGRPGICGEAAAGYVKIDYNCNNDIKCPCYVKPCEDDKCTEEMKGKCVNLPNKPPTGYVPSGYNCQGNQECPCYIEKTECFPDDKCTDENGLMGKCGETAAGYGKSSINCNQDPNCPCYLPCKSQTCEKNGGKCVLLSAKDVVIPVGFKESKEWCSEKIRCKCFIPNCTRTSSCKKAGGYCFNKKPTGGISLPKGKCTKKCKCFRVPIIGIAKPIG